MKVFISWSGERSRRVAELLDDWIQNVIQTINPWMSSKDIDRGSLWFTEISDQLSAISIGIVCVTRENMNKPWILFEAGALAKGISSNRVCTFLIDLQPIDLHDPLAQFNHTLPNKGGLLSLVQTINKSLQEKAMPFDRLEKAFNTYWPEFDQKLQEILKETSEGEIEPKEEIDTNELLKDILSTVRSFDKRLRNVEGEKSTTALHGYFVVFQFIAKNIPNKAIRPIIAKYINSTGNRSKIHIIDIYPKLNGKQVKIAVENTVLFDSLMNHLTSLGIEIENATFVN